MNGKESYEAMLERHEREIKDLQDNCEHPSISEWILSMWAPGHVDGAVRICENCGKIMERSDDPSVADGYDLLVGGCEVSESCCDCDGCGDEVQ